MSAWPEFHRELRARVEREFAACAKLCDAPPVVWQQRPSEDAWNGAEIVEHVALANHFLGLLAAKFLAKSLARARRGATLPAEPPDLARLAEIAPHAFAWRHPEHMAPTGALSREELRARLCAQRDGLLAGLDAAPLGEGSLARVRVSVVGGDRLDFYELAEFIRLHAARHRAQFARNVATLNGPPPPAV